MLQRKMSIFASVQEAEGEGRGTCAPPTPPYPIAFHAPINTHAHARTHARTHNFKQAHTHTDALGKAVGCLRTILWSSLRRATTSTIRKGAPERSCSEREVEEWTQWRKQVRPRALQRDMSLGPRPGSRLGQFSGRLLPVRRLPWKGQGMGGGGCVDRRKGWGRHARSARAPEEHVADHVGRHQRRVQRRCFPRSAPQRRLHPSPQRLPRVGAGWSGCALHRNASCAGMRLAECRIACALLAPLPHHPIPPTPSARSMIVGWIAFQIYRRLERAIDRCSHPC